MTLHAFAPDAVGAQAKEPSFILRDVTVAYRSYKERATSLKEAALSVVRRGRLGRGTTFNALSHVSLDVPQGSVLGIIGSNGSGKSTLLKVLAGVLKPTSGTVVRNGTIASLIELGVGFDPELNAVENIYLYGSLHKRTRSSIRGRVDHILDFAELKDFATTPIKYYSSGMAARLGFSVAVDIDPDILLVDEILGVGDERFQLKCQAVFDRFLKSGKTVIIVTHDMNLVERVAQDVLLISRGQIVFHGDAAAAIARYRDRAYETALHD